MTEQELIKKAQKGDEHAFEELFRLYETKIYHHALRMCGNHPEDAVEISQEAFLSAWKGLAFFRGESSFSTWLYRLTSNAAIDYLRREKRQTVLSGPSLDDEETYIDPPDESSLSPHDHAVQKEMGEALTDGLNTLTPEHREVLLLRELQGFTYDEIASTLSLDLGTVKSRIARGREKLRKYLVQCGNFSEYLPSKHSGKEGMP